jgi:hypothetical protein
MMAAIFEKANISVSIILHMKSMEIRGFVRIPPGMNVMKS